MIGLGQCSLDRWGCRENEQYHSVWFTETETELA